MLLLELTGFFAFILVFGALLPAGQFYNRYYIHHDPAHDRLRIQGLASQHRADSP